MLNLDLIDALYAGLPKNKQQELIGMLFKRSKQTMNYFHRTKDISLSKFEILADYFHMSLDSLRIGGGANITTEICGNINNTNLINENLSLQKENSSLKERIKDLQARIVDKDALVQMQADMIRNLKNE